MIKNNVKVNKAINIHTSEGILTGIKNDLGVGYIISDIIKNDDNYKCIDVNEKLHEEDIVIIYNRKFLTKAPIKFIQDYINLEIK